MDGKQIERERNLTVKMPSARDHLLCTMLLVCFFICIGCSSLHTSILGEHIRSSYSERLDFETPLTPKPKDLPILLREKIDTALYHFKKGHYSEACDLFLQSMDIIENTRHPLSRECGKAAAVSALMDGDRKRFKRIMTRLDHSFSALERFTYQDKVYKELSTLATELR